MMFTDNFIKTANGDMLEYFRDNPKKHEEWKERRKKKEALKKEKMKGGKADGDSDSKFNKKDLKEGSKEEMEHTKSKPVAKEIAKDHLKEHPKYYKYHEKMEEKMEKESAANSNIYRGLEHLGLGTLSLPAWKDVHEQWGKKTKHAKKEKFKAGAEIAGLGALHVATEAAHTGSPLSKLLSKKKILQVAKKVRK